jgi:hypothetical protein
LTYQPFNLQQHNGDFYFLDKYRGNQRLFCFTSDGELKYMIGRHGRGPGEYLALADYCISNDILYVWDRMRGNINQYDSQDGRYLATTSVEVKTDYQSFSILDDSLYVLCTRGNYSDIKYIGNNDCVHIFGKDGKEKQSFLKMGEEYNMRAERYSFQNSAYVRRDTLFMTMPFNNRLYAITPEGVSVKYRFTFGEKSDIDDFIKANSGLDDDEFDEQRRVSNVHVLFPTFIEKDSYIISRVDSEVLGLFVWDKDSGISYYYNYQLPGLSFLMGAGNPIYSGEGDNLLGTILPHEVARYIEYDFTQVEGSNNSKAVQKQLSNLDIKEDDNPLIIVAILKN